MPLTGSIQTISLPGIIQLLCSEAKTGFLKVRRNNLEYQVFLLEGKIVYAVQALKEAKLGHYLVQDGIISMETLYAALKTARSQKIAVGKILVDQGHISFETLKKYIHKQILEIFCHIFEWETGEYQFIDSEYNLKWLIVVKLNTLQLVMEALHHTDRLHTRCHNPQCLPLG